MNYTCFICGHKEVSYIGDRDDKNVFRCRRCSTVYSNPIIISKYDDYYSNGNYSILVQEQINHTPYDKRFFHDVKIAKTRLWGPNGIGDILESLKGIRGLRIVDVGAANGGMVNALFKCDAKEVVAIEPDNIMREFIRNHSPKVMCFNGLSKVPYGNYDFVFFYDSLEHMVDPYGQLKLAYELLDYDRFIVIEQPDPSSEVAIMEGIDWKHIRPDQHIFLFSPETIGEFLEEIGFTIIRVSRFMGDRFNIVARKIK